MSSIRCFECGNLVISPNYRGGKPYCMNCFINNDIKERVEPLKNK